MEDAQNPDIPGNSNVDDTGNKPESITSVMNAMGESTEPKSEPVNNGENGEGTKEKSQITENPKWMAQLDKESLEDADLVKQLGKFQKLGDLAKSYANLEKKLGNSVNIPGENATAEELRAFYSKLGVPVNADGYSIKDEKAGAFREIAFNNNLTDSQAKAIYEGLAQMGQRAVEASQEQMAKLAAESDRQLHEEWGQEYQKNLEFLKRGVAAYGGNSLGAKLKASGLLFDADVVKMFVSIGKANAESTSTTKGTGGKADYKSTADGGHFDFGL